MASLTLHEFKVTSTNNHYQVHQALRVALAPRITAWRTLNSLVLLSFGTTKAVLAFRGNPTVNAWDMALGLGWAFMCVSLLPPRVAIQLNCGLTP